MDDLDEFLSQPPPKAPARACKTCRHPRAEEINADLREFARRRGLPRDDEQFTAIRWRDFWHRYLNAKYADLPKDNSCVRHHAASHLGVDVPL